MDCINNEIIWKEYRRFKKWIQFFDLQQINILQQFIILIIYFVLLSTFFFNISFVFTCIKPKCEINESIIENPPMFICLIVTFVSFLLWQIIIFLFVTHFRIRLSMIGCFCGYWALHKTTFTIKLFFFLLSLQFENKIMSMKDCKKKPTLCNL